MAFEIIDTHLHVYDLKLKASFPNQNWTIVDFPDPVNEKAIAMDTTQEYAKEIANKSGVKKVVMVMCFDDCPEETQWVKSAAFLTIIEFQSEFQKIPLLD